MLATPLGKDHKNIDLFVVRAYIAAGIHCGKYRHDWKLEARIPYAD